MVVNSDPLQVVPAYPLHRGVELGLKPDSGIASWWNYILAGELTTMMMGINLVIVVFQFAALLYFISASVYNSCQSLHVLSLCMG